MSKLSGFWEFKNDNCHIEKNQLSIHNHQKKCLDVQGI